MGKDRKEGEASSRISRRKKKIRRMRKGGRKKFIRSDHFYRAVIMVHMAT